MAEKKKNVSKKQSTEKNTEEVVEIKKTKEEKKQVAEAKHRISQRNIYIIIGIIIVLAVVGFYIFRLQQARNEERLNSSYLISSGTVSLEIKNLDEVSQILLESPTEYFVLITYTGNEDTYSLEEGIKSIIDDYKLSDSFYYLNVESIMDSDNYLTRLNNAFNTDKITTVPIILYFKDGELVDTVTRDDDNIINAGDFQKLLDIYEYEGE
mgnify:FL=1